MWIVRLALRRPYTFVVGALVLLLLTPFVLLRTPTDIFPAINIPVVSAVWTYNGLSAQEIEQRIVFNHERAIATQVDDIEHIESTSYNGAGVIKVFLQPGASVETAIAQMTASSQSILKTMPRGITPPFILRYNAATVPILQYSFASQKYSEAELQDMTFNQVKVGLAGVRGASVPNPNGGKQRVVSVDLNLAALQAKHLSAMDVVAALDAQNLVLPSGTAKIGPTEYAVVLNSNPDMLEDLNNVPVKTINGAIIHLRDVAWVRDGYLPQQNVVRLNGSRGVLLTVLKAGTASTLDVVRGVKTAMSRIMAGMPPELAATEFSDQSLFVRAAVKGVVIEGIIAAALTSLMILLFLGTWRSTLIVTISIPLSVLASIAALSALGQTINLMTLGGLALSVGILVDHATVAIENIHSHQAQGKAIVQAILDGAQEISMPAFVTTLCICIVFVPMFFLQGTARFLFIPFALAVMFAVTASYVLSRTLVPTLVMWLHRGTDNHGAAHDQSRSADFQSAVSPTSSRQGVGTTSGVENVEGQRIGNIGNPRYGRLEVCATWLALLLRPFVALQRRFERSFDHFRESYRRWLGTALEHWRLSAALFVGFFAASALLLPYLGRDFFPQVDAGQIRLHLRTRSGTRIEETAKLTDQIEAEIRRVIPPGEVAGVLDNVGMPAGGIPLNYLDNGLVGTGDADILVSLKPGHEPTEDYVRQLRRRLNEAFPGTLFYFLPSDIVSRTINFGLAAPIDIQVVGRAQAKNRAVAARLADRIRRISGIVDTRVQQPADQPWLEFAVDRVKASDMGLTERDVANAMLLSLIGTSDAQAMFWLNPRNGVQYRVNVRVPESEMDSLAALQAIPVSTRQAGGGSQLVANLGSFSRSQNSPIINHADVMPVIDVLAGVSGRDLGSTLTDVKAAVAAAEKELPPGSYIILRGQAETMSSSFTGLGIGLLMALVLIYLLLVVNYQSWLDAFIIITALPGALAGVVWALYLTFTTLSVPALMGAIMCLGVATANSVLVVSFARENLHRGLDPLTAAWEAGVGRLRPVLMTALAMIIGMLPMALGLGEGGEQNAPLGRAVIGGLVVATFATLVFVPVVFCLLHRHARVKNAEDFDAVLAPAPAS